MLYVGIDQHKRHLTVYVRNEQGDMTVRRQVRTGWEEVDSFLESLLSQSLAVGGYVVWCPKNKLTTRPIGSLLMSCLLLLAPYTWMRTSGSG